MKYHDWQSRFDEAFKKWPEFRKQPLHEMLRELTQSIVYGVQTGEEPPKNARPELDRIVAEYLWLVGGRPYYNVHPQMVDQLCRCTLDGIPSEYLEIPGGFDAVHVRLAARHEDLTVDGEEYVRSILVEAPILQTLDAADRKAFLNSGRRPQVVQSGDRLILLHVDLGHRHLLDGVLMTDPCLVPLHLDSSMSLDELFDSNDAGLGISPRCNEVLKNCLRIVATVGFLANCPDDNLIQYDILSKHRAEFATADQTRRKQLIDKARRRGKHGWNIGTKEMILGTLSKWSTNGSTGTKGEHAHAHIRSGHLHAVRYGEGRRHVKIKWFRPTVVRPDLPFAGSSDCVPLSEARSAADDNRGRSETSGACG